MSDSNPLAAAAKSPRTDAERIAELERGLQWLRDNVCRNLEAITKRLLLFNKDLTEVSAEMQDTARRVGDIAADIAELKTDLREYRDNDGESWKWGPSDDEQ